MKKNDIKPQDVALIIVTYKNISDTLRCLHSIYALDDMPGWIVIVDNNYVEKGIKNNMLLEWINIAILYKYELPKQYNKNEYITNNYIYILLHDNKGYAAACNTGILKLLDNTSCKAFWILNNDTLVHKDALGTLCTTLSTQHDAGMVSGISVSMDDHETIHCVGGGTFSRFFGITRDIGTGLKINNLQYNIEDIKKNIDYLCGASILIKKEVILAAGVLDEKYFLYYEDVDYSLAAKKAGFSLAVTPDSIIYHKQGASTSSTGLVDFYCVRNRLYCVYKFYPQYILFSIVYALLGIIKSIIFKKKFILRIKAITAFLHMRHASITRQE
jgi:GT2 family glycosyltransferase